MLCSFSNCAGDDHCHNNLKEESEECLFYFRHVKYIIPICSCTKSETTFNMVESSIMKSFLSPIIRILMEKKRECLYIDIINIKYYYFNKVLFCIAFKFFSLIWKKKGFHLMHL